LLSLDDVSPTTFPKAEKNSLRGQKGPLSSNAQPVSSHWKAFGKVQTSVPSIATYGQLPFGGGYPVNFGILDALTFHMRLLWSRVLVEQHVSGVIERSETISSTRKRFLALVNDF
jgi:hypothetical protein